MSPNKTSSSRNNNCSDGGVEEKKQELEEQENETQASSRSCPFAPIMGYSTSESRREYLAIRGLSEDEDDVPTTSLMADPDPSQPLYYWQLYSLLGSRPIVDICTEFYRLVYADNHNDNDNNDDDDDDDDTTWFLEVFEQAAPQSHHIAAQAAYWIDAMGGERRYPGGRQRLTYHHLYYARDIMNRRGAHQWMMYMRSSTRTNYVKHAQLRSDERVLPCLVDFWATKMKAYADFHDWDFDANDFRLEDFYPTPMVTTARSSRGLGGDDNDDTRLC